jgi:hypothetical protein
MAFTELRRGENGAENINGLVKDAVGVADVTYTIGTEAADVINVAGQVVDNDGDAISGIRYLTVFLSDDAEGIDKTGTAPATSVAIGTNGYVINVLEAKISFIVQTDADGAFDLDITDTTGATWYMVAVMGTEASVSDAITFTT